MIPSDVEPLIARAADLIRRARRIVVFTGAGVSTESGIPDFRSPGGIWDLFDPEDFTYHRYLTSAEARRKNWLLLSGSGALIDAQPNPAHLAIADLERMGKLDCVITQNIDNLHQKAGNSEERVIELHGTAKRVRCLSCRQEYASEDILVRLRAGEDDPRCERCGGLLKLATISFGEEMPLRETLEAERSSRRCDLFIVVGSSLVVYPAAEMPSHALAAGGKLIIVNLEATYLDDQADVVIHARAGEVFSAIMAHLRDRM